MTSFLGVLAEDPAGPVNPLDPDHPVDQILRPFSSGSPWNRPVDWTVDQPIQEPYGSMMVDLLAREVERRNYSDGLIPSPNTNGAPAFNTGTFGLPIYRVDSRVTPLRRVQLIGYNTDKIALDPDDDPAGPGHLRIPQAQHRAEAHAIQAAADRLEPNLMAVPIPPGLTCAPPTAKDAAESGGKWDGHCLIIDTWTRQAWGMWKFRDWYPDGQTPLDNGKIPARHWFLDATFPDGSKGGQGQHSCQWGEYIEDIGSHPGWYSGAATKYWGARASSTSAFDGLITPEDAMSGVIGHALAFAIRHGSRRIRRPAMRTDAPHFPDATHNPVPQGQHLALPPDYDVDAARFDRYPLGKMVVRAMRDYGIRNVDTAGNFCFYCQYNTPPDFPGWKQGYMAGAFSGDVVASLPFRDLIAIARPGEGLFDALGNPIAEGM